MNICFRSLLEGGGFQNHMNSAVRTNRNNAPIFIVGAPRSGTTMLRLMLCAHPRIAIPHEANFVIELYPRFRNADFRNADVRNNFYEALCKVTHFTDSWSSVKERLRDDLDRAAPASYADAVDAVYCSFADNLKNAECRWGDKNIASITHVRELAELFPKAQFIHIVRDGRDAAASQRKLWAYFALGGRYYSINNPAAAAKLWVAQNRAAIAAGERLNAARYLRIRYEDLVVDPEPWCKRICEFLGEEYDEMMLNFSRYNVENKLISTTRLNAYHQNTTKPVLKNRVEVWKKDLPEWYAAIFTSYARKLLDYFGYDLSGVSHGWRVKIGGAAAGFWHFASPAVGAVRKFASAIRKLVRKTRRLDGRSKN